ncbi:MAG: hypothetical protein KA314_27090 [Chloroflexi bacterium]|nr:hypothetical protein [Chloroflexota bacterium]MBP8059519.1 hypothetical protein [Chloroflexota bacterium]
MSIMIGFGLVLIGIFATVKMGFIKSWFILKTLPGLLSARMIYTALPLGLCFIFLAFVPMLPNYDPDIFPFTYIAICIMWSALAVWVWFMYKPPEWIKPEWLRWLEREYGYCIPILIEEAQKMNRWVWEAKVRKPEGLQAWIDDVFEHRSEEVEQAWLMYKIYLLHQQMVKDGQEESAIGVVIRNGIPKHRQHDAVVKREELLRMAESKKQS